MNSIPPRARFTISCTFVAVCPTNPETRPAAIGLDEMTPVEDAEHAVDLREQPCHRRLAGPRIPDEHEVPAAVGNREVVRPPELLDASEVHEEPNLALHVVEADELVELVEQCVQRRRGRGRLTGKAAQCRGVGCGSRVGRRRRPLDRVGAQVLQEDPPVLVERGEAAAGRNVGERADRVADPERGFVVRPRVRVPPARSFCASCSNNGDAA